METESVIQILQAINEEIKETSVMIETLIKSMEP